MTDLVVEIIGWAGAALVLGGYILVTTGRVTGGSAVFQCLNALGSLLFIFNTWWHGAIPSMALNIIWCAIGIFTLGRIAIKRGKGGNDEQS